MTKFTVALAIAALMGLATTPALAHCGGSHGKGYRAAQSPQTPKKVTTAKAAQPKAEPAPTATTSAPEFMPGSGELEGDASRA